MKLNDISEHKRKKMVLKIKENDVRVFKINGVENDVNEHMKEIKGNNKITELRTILQRESQNS